MNSTHKIALVGILGLGIIGVFAYFEKQMKLLKNACYTLAGAIIHEISFNKVKFSLLLNISNRSDIDFSVTQQNYNIYVNRMLVATIHNPEKVRVAARGKSTINIDVSFNPQDLLKKGIENIGHLIKNRDEMVIEIKGYLSLRAGAITIKNYEVDERLTLKELLSPSPKKTKC